MSQTSVYNICNCVNNHSCVYKHPITVPITVNEMMSTSSRSSETRQRRGDSISQQLVTDTTSSELYYLSLFTISITRTLQNNLSIEIPHSTVGNSSPYRSIAVNIITVLRIVHKNYVHANIPYIMYKLCTAKFISREQNGVTYTCIYTTPLIRSP